MPPAVRELPKMRVAIVLEPGSTASSVMTTLDMFRIASRFPAGKGSQVRLFSSSGGPIPLAGAVTVQTQGLPKSLDGHDAIIVPGFFGESLEHIVAQLQSVWAGVIARLGALEGDTLVAASCYGTFLLAESGLLDGRPATTTWWFAQAFRQRYPRVRLDADKTLVDAGKVITAGAMTAHTDLSLHLLRRLGGLALAREVGNIMLVDGARSSQRPFMAVQKQFSDPLAQRAANWMLERLARPFSIEALAAGIHVSYRTLNRRFTEATGQAPLSYLQALRVERAKELLESTEQDFEAITEAVGYGDAPSFRRLFKRLAGLSPAQYRRRFRGRTA